MFLDKQMNKATKKMLLKHKLRLAAREMSIIPGINSTLVNVPKLADSGYSTVFSKTGAAIYDDHTTTITANKPPVLNNDWCNLTGLWKLSLQEDYQNNNQSFPQKQNEAINIIFHLSSAHQTFLWYHALVGFPTRETFIRAVCNGNYTTWPKLTVAIIHRHMPNSDKTAKGHLKCQQQGI